VKALIVENAARGGHITALKWTWEKWIRGTADCCMLAANHGHLDALQWLREKGCPWDTRVISKAAVQGHRHVVEWARANGCPEPEEPNQQQPMFD
jgi:hypothetical protein